jgi:CBS domain-containing protein
MKVESILAIKGRTTVTISPTASIAALIDLLNEKRIGAIVASADGRRVDGIISERDVVMALSRHGASVMDMQVGEVMTRDVVTGSTEDDVDEVMGVMTRRRIRHLPLVADDALCGMVSIGDLVKAKLDHTEREAQAMREFIQS